jgi:YfiH family protein
MRLPEPFFALGEHLAVDLPGARAVFTTRRGGVSVGSYAGLNLGRWTDDDPEAVERNRVSLASWLGVRPAYGRQVHGPTVTSVTEAPDESELPAAADGQATATGGIAPMVLTADCLPVALAGDGAVAMLHAGWRGLASGILAEGVSALLELGASGPLTAAIGPGAGVCCYEVGDEVHEVFRGHVGARRGRNVDLKAIARAELHRAGVERVHDAQLCTICAGESLFFSHRRDQGITGRQAGLVWLS